MEEPKSDVSAFKEDRLRDLNFQPIRREAAVRERPKDRLMQCSTVKLHG